LTRPFRDYSREFAVKIFAGPAGPIRENSFQIVENILAPPGTDEAGPAIGDQAGIIFPHPRQLETWR